MSTLQAMWLDTFTRVDTRTSAGFVTARKPPWQSFKGAVPTSMTCRVETSTPKSALFSQSARPH
jgi:hypothetical protein